MQLSDTFLKHFDSLTDPRIDNHNKLHNLHDILVITILATICGADNWVDINEFGDDGENQEELDTPEKGKRNEKRRKIMPQSSM